MYGNGSIQRTTIRTYGLMLKSAKRNHLWSSNIIILTNNTVGRWVYENGSIQHWNIRTYKLVLKWAKKLIFQLHAQNLLPIILLGVECTKMVAFNALTSGPMDSCLNQLKKLICDLDAQYPLPIILLGIECSKMVAFNALTSGPMDSCLNPLDNSFSIFTQNCPYQYYCWALNVRKW